jgi:hypothetical protein
MIRAAAQEVTALSENPTKCHFIGLLCRSASEKMVERASHIRVISNVHGGSNVLQWCMP